MKYVSDLSKRVRRCGRGGGARREPTVHSLAARSSRSDARQEWLSGGSARSRRSRACRALVSISIVHEQQTLASSVELRARLEARLRSGGQLPPRRPDWLTGSPASHREFWHDPERGRERGEIERALARRRAESDVRRIVARSTDSNRLSRTTWRRRLRSAPDRRRRCPRAADRVAASARRFVRAAFPDRRARTDRPAPGGGRWFAARA